jgi:ribosomal protein L37AE/L43A
MITTKHIPTDELCPNCNSEHTIYNSDYGFWQCEECSNVWAYNEDDPDYDEPYDDPC